MAASSAPTCETTQEHAREHVIALLQRIYNSTNDERFHSALDIMLKDKDAV